MRSIGKLFLLLLTNFPAWGQPANLPDSLYNIQDSVLIPTRDGHFISSIIVRRKENKEALPVVLFYTTYYQGPGDSFFGKISADRDYVGVVAYSRGIRANIDDYFPYEHDGADVYDVIDWISKQPWCNGKVGMFGGSYTGFVQWSTAKKLHPALKTIVPQVAVMPGFDVPMENNVHLAFTLGWANDILNYPKLSEDLNQNWFIKGTSYRSLDSLAGEPNKIFQKWLLHPDYDSYWRSLVPTPSEYANIDIPILCTTGYYDGAQVAALQYVKQYYKYNRTRDLYFVIGPYDHFGAQRQRPALNLMGYDIDSVANTSMRELAFQWFDYILKGKNKPEILRDKINYEVMGANVWKHAPTFERANNDTITFFLSDRKEGTGYLLTPEKPWQKNYLRQTADFNDRTTQNNYFTPFIINDSIDVSTGVLFRTKPFEKTFSMNGRFLGSLVTSINKKDMDVSIAFYEQMPNGKYFYLTRYLGRASYAKDNSKRQLLKPNEETKIAFDKTRFVSKQISKGSRLAIILNVNKHPYEEINYGTGKAVSDETIADAKEPLQIKWFIDSYIKVPVWIDKK
jgi:putative CocE/NonD family hydrolase